MMTESLITILTVNYKTSDFIDLMLSSFEKLTYNSYKVIICDNYTSDNEIIKLKKVIEKYQNIEVIFRKQTQVGSIGHAEAMDILVDMVDTKYFVTMDSDAIFLLKDWDKKMIEKIDDDIKVIGTTLPEAHNSYKKNLKPMDFPLVFAVLYETKVYKELAPSFMPENLSSDNSKDTGWEIREKYLSNGFNGIVFNGLNTRFIKDTPFGSIICAVYYMDDNLIASHFSRGSSDGSAKYNNKWWLKLPFISKFIRKYIGKKEKKEWINTCSNIINIEVLK